jgi:lycopene beta-cyclase
MIRGIDFYKHCFKTIREHNNIDIIFKEVNEIFSGNETGIVVDGETIYADYVFNSILFEKPALKNESWLLQHFKGWLIESEENVFDESTATLMDFRIDQKFGTTFCYVLPLNSKRTLVEYTVFSAELLHQDQYEEALQSYINEYLKLSSYQIIEKEFGAIPMTNFKFPVRQNKIINIGTAGGQTKGSSGYTFNFIQKHSKTIVDSLIATSHPFVPAVSNRFNFYDSVLLRILDEGSLPGKNVFTDLFKKNPVEKVFKFLDNETSVSEELKIISSLPTLPFLKAGLQQII